LQDVTLKGTGTPHAGSTGGMAQTLRQQRWTGAKHLACGPRCWAPWETPAVAV